MADIAAGGHNQCSGFICDATKDKMAEVEMCNIVPFNSLELNFTV